MNNNRDKDQDSYRSFLLMSELEKDDSPSQRELAKRLGIAVGLVNSYLKNFVAKGFIRVKNYPRNRYTYLLTPKGIAEKSRLAYQHLNYFTGLYTTTRQDYLALFRSLEADGVRSVVFCGVDEVAEIAFLSLQETGIELDRVIDDAMAGKTFFQYPVGSLSALDTPLTDNMIITSLKRGDQLRSQLLEFGIPPEQIHFSAGAGAKS